MAGKWKNCKRCGNRFPESEGVGPDSEFCCEGCWEEWEQKHPGYTKETRIGKILGFIGTCILIMFLIYKCCVKIGPV